MKYGGWDERFFNRGGGEKTLAAENLWTIVSVKVVVSIIG